MFTQISKHMTIKTYFYPVLLALLVVLSTACKSKKLVTKTEEPSSATQSYPAEVKPAEPAPAPAPEPAPAPAPKPDLNFTNIQFEFNSAVLKTESYPELDKAAAAIKQSPDVKFVLNGNSSAEGTEQHNLQLSEERANSVKQYFVNAGVSADVLTVKGYGESKPIASNKTEDGRALNRRVEIKAVK